MKLSELMADVTVNPNFKGELMADDFVLAINVGGKDKATDYNDYAVVQEHVEGVDSSLNAESNDKQYIRGGRSTSKKSVQRTFTVSADRYVGDDAQDFIDSKKYAVGEDCVTEYVYFNIKTGKGEKGNLSIAVDADGGGNAGDNASFTATLSKNGAKPEDYTYSAL